MVQVREEAGELCQTLEAGEGRERAASEMADLMYHAMVLLNLQVCSACVGAFLNFWTPCFGRLLLHVPPNC